MKLRDAGATILIVVAVYWVVSSWAPQRNATHNMRLMVLWLAIGLRRTAKNSRVPRSDSNRFIFIAGDSLRPAC